jgi:hypothetical protein
MTNRSRNGCPVAYELQRCPALQAYAPDADAAAAAGAAAAATAAAAADGEVCVVVRTSKPIPAGREVCIAYGHLTPDAALMQYGFAIHAPVGAESAGGADAAEALALSKVDERDVVMEDVTTERLHGPPQPRLTGACVGLGWLVG